MWPNTVPLAYRRSATRQEPGTAFLTGESPRPGRRRTRAPSPAELVEEAIDPVCGMTVAVAAAKETAVRDGVTYYFCSAHCRKRFKSEAAHV